jgi:tRNA (guanine26-N2/guanine27-N2)-dimethyltransferase
LEEEGMKFAVAKGVFYNPAMRLCRSMSSLAVGAIGSPLEVVDAFCASGIRGIRYAKENRNVRKLTSIDIDPACAASARKNLKAARLRPASAVKGNVSRLAFEYDADFIELDPFGTPAPYVVDAFRYLNTKKLAYVSATATDVAVLCGGKTAPCMKHYGAKPLNNEFTHETGLRILLKKMAETAAEFNMGMEPLASFSDQHYLKSIVRVKRGADLAYASQKKLGHISWCGKCGWRGSGRFPQPCGNCGTGGREPETDFAGPLWLGELHDAQFLGKMAALNRKRGYADAEKLAEMLSLMEGEAGMPPYYYNVHELCSMRGLGAVPKMDAVLAKLRQGGFAARRTHFSPVSVKTDAPYKAVLGALG